MATKEDLPDWVLTALIANGGSSRLIDVAKYIWLHHEVDLRDSGDLFLNGNTICVGLLLNYVVLGK